MQTEKAVMTGLQRALGHLRNLSRAGNGQENWGGTPLVTQETHTNQKPPCCLSDRLGFWTFTSGCEALRGTLNRPPFVYLSAM